MRLSILKYAETLVQLMHSNGSGPNYKEEGSVTEGNVTEGQKVHSLRMSSFSLFKAQLQFSVLPKPFSSLQNHPWLLMCDIHFLVKYSILFTLKLLWFSDTIRLLQAANLHLIIFHTNCFPNEHFFLIDY